MSDASRDRGQSSPVGVVLILGLTMTAAVGILVVGGDAIQGTQSSSEVGQAEQAMTQFDARAAQVALGDSDSQTVSLGGQGGSYSIQEDVGRVRLLHQNWNGTGCDCGTYSGSKTEDNGNTTILYNQTLGALVYESGDSQVAYQGGGVWRKDDDGAARPVSSPEFHYRDATLTFPLVRVEGSGGAGGQVTATVRRVETTRDIYPNQSETYPDDDRELTNPVHQGNMTVEVTSDYCEGWREYFEERTDGDVSECNGDTVTADIVALGTQGKFDPTGGNEIEMRGQKDGHTLQEFDFDFRESKPSADFKNFGWSMKGEEGEKRFEIVLEFTNQGGGSDNCGEAVDATIYYSEDDHDTYHTWGLDDSTGSDPFKITCPDGEERLEADLLNGSRSWTYTDRAGELMQYQNEPDTFAGGETLSEHPADPGNTYSSPDAESVDLVVQHYFALMGDMTLEFDEKSNGASNLGDDSTGTISYEGGGNVVTYLHVTENRVEIELS
jgi:hypothetical protein